MIIAKAGEIVTCENGHQICVVATDIGKSDIFGVDAFKDWKIDIPTYGAAIDQMHECGGLWSRYGPHWPCYPQIHIDGGWRGCDCPLVKEDA